MQIGDYIDDYCSRCKRTADHSVTALVGEEAVKVSCRTCGNEHKYRGNKGKKEMTASQAFDKVLASMTAQLGGSSQAKPSRKKKS
jgi:RNase P subunit RPR2